MYKGEEKFYTVLLFLLILGEIFLAIPFATEAMLKDENVSFLIYVIGGHIFCLLYALSGQLDNGGAKAFHINGIVSYVLSAIPVLNFLWHIYVVILGYFGIKKMIADIRYNDTIIGVNDEKSLRKRYKDKKLKEKLAKYGIDDENEQENELEESEMDMFRNSYHTEQNSSTSRTGTKRKSSAQPTKVKSNTHSPKQKNTAPRKESSSSSKNLPRPKQKVVKRKTVKKATVTRRNE